MSMRELDRLTGTAMVEPHVGEALLDERRPEVLTSFDLTAEERTMLACIEARTLPEFFQKLYRWMNERNGHQLPLRGNLGRTWPSLAVEPCSGLTVQME
jgi:hypothetical protein